MIYICFTAPTTLYQIKIVIVGVKFYQQKKMDNKKKRKHTHSPYLEIHSAPIPFLVTKFAREIDISVYNNFVAFACTICFFIISFLTSHTQPIEI